MDPMPTNIHFDLQMIMSLLFYLMLGLYAVFTVIVYFHWTTYAANKVVSRFTLLSYFGITLPLLLIMSAILLTI